MTLSPAYLQKGDEQYEVYWSSILKAERVQYDYRDHDGELFTCIGTSLDDCRAKRDAWQRDRAH